jgi:uncharacterized protein (DUF2062 family)
VSEEAPSFATRARAALARFLRWLVLLRGSPEAIAGGVAIGIFVAFTPTVGLQILLATGLATLLGASRPAAILFTTITSPPTFVPVYAFTYWVGSFFWSGPPVAEVSATLGALLARMATFHWSEIAEPVRLAAAMTREALVPFWIGGVLVGSLGAGIAYPVTLRGVRFSRARLARLRERRARRRAARGSRGARR